MSKVMGVDLGKTRTGIAISDSLLMTAQGLETYHSNSLSDTCDRIAALAKQHSVSEIALGLPKNLDNSIGERAEVSMKLAEMLRQQHNLTVVLWDERLTTVSAIKTLNETNTRGKKRKAVIDMVSAVLILQSYLDYKAKQ